MTSWGCELGSPNLLMRNGWSRDALKAGDVVIVTGSRAKDGSNIANARTVRLADGKRIFNAGSRDQPERPQTAPLTMRSALGVTSIVNLLPVTYLICSSSGISFAASRPAAISSRRRCPSVPGRTESSL